MTKLFTFGCSLTHSYGWKNVLAEKIGYELVNSAMYAGSNDLQVRRLHSHIINGNISKDDIIIWQITSQVRSSFSIRWSNQWTKRLDHNPDRPDDPKYEGMKFFIDAPENYFDGTKHTDILSNHSIIKESAEFYDSHQSLEELFSTIILLNNNYRILVFVGWQGALDQWNANYDKSMQLLAHNNIPHMPESLLDWVINNDLELDSEDPTGLHPTMEASEAYAERALYPKLQELGWT